MDADVDSAWICTQAIVSTDSQSDDEKEKINNYGYIVLNDMIDNEHYILKEGDNTIGRHPLNHIYIEHPSVSMNHAVIQCDSDGVVLLDKGSLNKTKLNKKILRKDVAYFLEENSLLMFGEVQADYFINEKSIELKNDTKSMAPANTFVHKAAQNDGLSLSKLSNTVITPKSFRTDIPNAISDCNVSLVIENKSTCKIEKEVPKTIIGTECAMNTLNDIHPNINSLSPSDEYLLEALSQVETKQNNVNSNKIVHNLSNEDTLIMNLTESVSEITREDTLSPVMDLKSSILTTHNVTKNQFQSPNKINTEAMREDTPSPVMDLKSSILTTNNIPTIIFQSPSKINKELIREDTPSPIMDFGCCNDFENNLETNNYGITLSIQSPNEVDKFNNTQVLEIDSNIVELNTHTSNNNEVQNVESGKQSIIPIKNCLDNLSGSNNINLSTNGNNTDKHKIIVNTFEADDDDVFRHFIEEECKSQQHDLTILENQDFFNCPTQKVSIKKNIQSKVTSSIQKKESQNLIDHSKSIKNNASASKIIHDDLTQITEMDDDFFNCPTQKVSTSKKVQPKDDEETQELLEFSKTCKSNSILSKSYSTINLEKNHQNAKIDDDFFNCPTQKLSTSNNTFPNTKVSPSIHEEETQRPPEFSQFIKTKNSASNNYSTNINKDLTEVPETEDDFFNCPTQKVLITKKVNPKPKVSSSINDEETQELLEFSKPCKSNSIVSKSYSTSIHEENTQNPKIDDDFFNCPTQKLSTSKNIFPKPKVSHSIHEEETQRSPEFSEFDKTNNIASNNYSTNINKDLTEVPDVDDDFFNCPTQKVLTSKKVRPKVISSIHDEETQELLEFSKPCKSNSIVSKSYSTSIHEENTQNSKIDDDFFNCPTQKLSTSRKINPKPKVFSSIHDEETQRPPEFSQFNKTNTITSKPNSISIYKENNQNPKMDDDFFNCPTQKLSISKKIFPKPKVSHSIHEEETQRPPEFSQFDKTNNIASNNYSINVNKDLTEVPEMDDDFFNCPTQKVSITKKQNPKPKISSSINDEETQELLEFSKPCKSNSIVSKSYSTSIHEENTQNPKIDDDFFNCPTQKLSTSKNIFSNTKVYLSIHEEETQIHPKLSQFDKTNNIASNNYSTNRHVDLTEVPEIDDDFFNCPTQKLLITKKLNPKPTVSSSIHEEETQRPPEFSQFDKTNNITSNTYSTSIHGDLKNVLKIDDEDFFNCPTQKVPCHNNSKFSKDCKKHELIPIFNNEAETKNLLIQSISNTISPINIKQNKGNIFNFTSQKVLTKVQSKSISNCSININEDVTKNPEQFDGSNSHKETVVPDNEDRCKVQKSKFVKSNIISPSNVQLPVMCNENSSNSLRTNKPNIRVREDLHYMSYSGGSSNDSTVILNKPNKNSVFNNINTTVPFNKNFDSPGCSKTTTFKKNDINTSSSTKQECFIDNSDQSQVSISLKYNSYLKQMNESIFSPLNIPDVSANSLLEDHSSPITIENNLNTLKCEPSTSSNDTFKWKSFWNKKKVQSQGRGKSDKQKSIKIAPEVKENKERYQTRAITRKRKLNGIVESNKKLCNRNNILEPLVGNSSEIVVSFSYLKSRHLQEMKQFVEKTGGTVTDEITQCTVLVTDKIRCTMKILSAIAKGCPIVNANWLKHSYTVKMFQDVDDFIIADKDAERKYKFQLKESLAKARTKRLLDGYNVLVTPSVKPGPQEMKVIITCAGGNFVLNWTTTQYTKELIVTCDKDRNRWKPAWDNDLAKIIDSDTLVMSIIRQQLTI